MTGRGEPDHDRAFRIGQLIFAARLLGNEMPEEIEEVFEKAQIPLFSKRQKDLKTECSCPDWSQSVRAYRRDLLPDGRVL